MPRPLYSLMGPASLAVWSGSNGSSGSEEGVQWVQWVRRTHKNLDHGVVGTHLHIDTAEDDVEVVSEEPRLSPILSLRQLQLKALLGASGVLGVCTEQYNFASREG